MGARQHARARLQAVDERPGSRLLLLLHTRPRWVQGGPLLGRRRWRLLHEPAVRRVVQVCTRRVGVPRTRFTLHGSCTATHGGRRRRAHTRDHLMGRGAVGRGRSPHIVHHMGPAGGVAHRNGLRHASLLCARPNDTRWPWRRWAALLGKLFLAGTLPSPAPFVPCGARGRS